MDLSKRKLAVPPVEMAQYISSLPAGGEYVYGK